ncbi:MAG: AMP-binding protein [Polyangiales bacterium]
MTSTLFSSIDSAADSAVALVLDGQPFTRAQLANAAAAHCEALARDGVRAGDRVAVWTDPGIEAAVALLGNALFGAVSVPLNPLLGTKELEHMIADAAPKLIFSGASRAHASRTAAIPTRVATIDARPSGPPPQRAVDDRPLLVLYTSGTTGAPKGAVLTARNVASNLDGLARAWGLTERDRIAHALPLFHVHGLCLGLFGALRVGASLDWSSRFDPRALAARFDAGATVLYAVPTMYHRLVELAECDAAVAASLGRARLLVSGSAPLSTREFHRVERACHKRVVERYGLTETLINCAVRHDDEPRAGWVGRAVDGVEVELVDDARQPTIARDATAIGELRVRGANVFSGYLNRPEATASAIDEMGWFYTGDLAVMDRDGWVKIVGRRATDLIKTGGYKVGAGEVEAAMREHPAVLDCAVVGVADDDLGERIEAFVIVRKDFDPPTEASLVAHVCSLISAHKRPRKVHWVSEFPRNAMGKVLKAQLRSMAR